jgi:CHASE2 domain-containing sensor protein
VNFPSRVVLALAVLGAVAAIGVWGIVVAVRARNMTEPQRMMAVGGIVILMAVLAAWVIFVWPAYWD